MINRTAFYVYVRNAPFGGRLSTGQVHGMEAVLDKWDSKPELTDKRWLAYMLATVFHETAQTMQPVRETLLKSDASVIAALDKAWANGKLKSVKTPYWRRDVRGFAWYGRGLVQLTHPRNYEVMGAILGIPLGSNPDLALDMKTSVDILFEGMTKGLSNKGDFTKYTLEDFFNGNTNDPIGARKIINGTDKNKLIAQYHGNFLDAIIKAEEVSAKGVLPAEIKREDAKPDDKPASSSGAVITTVSAIVGSGVIAQIGEIIEKGSNALSIIQNPYQLASVALIVLGLGVLVWLFMSGRLVLFRNPQVVK